MQILIDITDDGLTLVSVDGGEPMEFETTDEALDAVEQMIAPDDAAMWDEEAAAREGGDMMVDDEEMME